jgi:hypothetical protein
VLELRIGSFSTRVATSRIQEFFMADGERMFVERRAYRRFYIEGLALNSDASACAHLIDIGMGGMAFRYVDESSSWSTEQEEQGTISGQNFYLDNIPLITVAESELYNGIYTIRRHGVKFGTLTPEQRNTIEKIITAHVEELKKNANSSE